MPVGSQLPIMGSPETGPKENNIFLLYPISWLFRGRLPLGMEVLPPQENLHMESLEAGSGQRGTLRAQPPVLTVPSRMQDPNTNSNLRSCGYPAFITTAS